MRLVSKCSFNPVTLFAGLWFTSSNDPYVTDGLSGKLATIHFSPARCTFLISDPFKGIHWNCCWVACCCEMAKRNRLTRYLCAEHESHKVQCCEFSCFSLAFSTYLLIGFLIDFYKIDSRTALRGVFSALKSSRRWRWRLPRVAETPLFHPATFGSKPDLIYCGIGPGTERTAPILINVMKMQLHLLDRDWI